MLPLVVASLAALAAAQTPWPSFGNWTETAGGHTYVLSGPAKLGRKVDFELDRCRFVWDLLDERTHCRNKPAPSGDDAGECMAELYERKRAIGDRGFLDLFERDIEEARRFWYGVNRDSPARGDASTWKAVEARAAVALPNVTAATFAAWSASPGADEANNRGNAEHYFKHSGFEGASGASRILEGWGGTMTNFTMPNYGPALCARRGMVRALPEFGVKACGDKNLVDGGEGTNFGVLNIAARDVDGASFGQPGRRGIDIYAAVWYPSAISEEHLEAERQHVIIEIVNLSLKVQEEVERGLFPVVTTPPA
ncbi:hypothetical protein C8035_v008381 [Colletotrichum spinosum]|uniref:Uncharacterized protein n=1 Tax=Colletotrichum spinosum TaxID=1347390 RepID=A0A4R8QNS5_9PEZI|nr:hypothetical protein C8035_v008381 [Colletotrichum spinosum]